MWSYIDAPNVIWLYFIRYNLGFQLVTLSIQKSTVYYVRNIGNVFRFSFIHTCCNCTLFSNTFTPTEGEKNLLHTIFWSFWYHILSTEPLELLARLASNTFDQILRSCEINCGKNRTKHPFIIFLLVTCKYVYINYNWSCTVYVYVTHLYDK